jgi:hypothetical protein
MSATTLPAVGVNTKSTEATDPSTHSQPNRHRDHVGLLQPRS